MAEFGFQGLGFQKACLRDSSSRSRRLRFEPCTGLHRVLDSVDEGLVLASKSTQGVVGCRVTEWRVPL